ncbi:hypothetical protein [Pseudomonas sp. UBA6562]|uniref:hypothetical protein n=1 Tax=Pseudomonas sp. UBA6562 TaxID=1947332 RepID=UPI0025FD8FB3|nr:hypothetical protein [Pseudomonas sp. UBA6562]
MSMELRPELSEYRYALYCRSDRLDLSYKPAPPVALYRDKALAASHGARMWPSTYSIIDLLGEELPCRGRA